MFEETFLFTHIFHSYFQFLWPGICKDFALIQVSGHNSFYSIVHSIQMQQQVMT